MYMTANLVVFIITFAMTMSHARIIYRFTIFDHCHNNRSIFASTQKLDINRIEFKRVER